MFKKILTMLLTLMPGMAFAAGNMFDPVPDDKSLIILKAIFGGLGTFGVGPDPFGEGIKLFNGSALIIGGLLVAYTIIVGTVGTAHDGEMLGKKFSSVWIPIRTALGTALVLPVINGTYCVMQAIVGWLIVQGVGLADKVWEGYTSSTNMAFVASQGLTSTSARNLGYNIFKTVACTEIITQVIEDIKKTPAGVAVTDQKGIQSISPYNPNRIIFGASPTGNGLRADSCGNVDLPINSKTNVAPGTGVSGAITNYFDSNQLDAASLAITKANQEATKQLIKDLTALAKKMVTTKTPVNASQIDDAVAKYENTVNKAAAAEIGKLSDFKTLAANASKDGWYMAGAFYTKLSWFADTVHRATTNVGTANPPSSSIFDSAILKDSIQPYVELIAFTDKTNPAALPGGFGINEETGVKDADGAESMLGKIFKWNPLVLDEGEHPLMALKRVGNWLLGIYATVVTTSILLAGGSAGFLTKIGLTILTAGTFDVSKAIDTAINMIQPLVTPMLVVGLILSYILPMLPFFLWFGATLGWIVMCIEAIIAAPMWAVMHVTASGDEMLGSGAMGYKLVLSLILRPVLMIFGLVASFVIIQVVGEILTEVFFGVFQAGQSDSNIILKIIGALLIAPMMYAWAMFVLIKKAFSMIHVIPEEILKWFGGANSGQLGDFANTVGGEGQGAMAGAALMSRQAGDMAGKLAGDQIGKAKDLANKDKETDKKYAALTGGGNFKDSNDGGKALTKKDLDKKQAINNKIESAIGQLGGEGTIGASAFQEKLRHNMENTNMTAEDAIQSALEHGKDAQYGDGASEFVDNMGNEKFGGEIGGSAQAQNLLGNKYKKLEKAGLSHSQITSKLSDMMTNAMDRYKNGELNSKGNRASLIDLVGDESDKINKELALGSGYNSGQSASKDGIKTNFVKPSSSDSKPSSSSGSGTTPTPATDERGRMNMDDSSGVSGGTDNKTNFRDDNQQSPLFDESQTPIPEDKTNDNLNSDPDETK